MNRALILGIAIIALSFGGCKHIPEPAPGSIALHLTGPTAEVMRKVAGHTAVTPSRYGTLYLIPADQVTPYLACHEGVHHEQAATFANDADWLRAYFGESVRSALLEIQAIKDDPAKVAYYMTLVLRIVQNEVDLMALTKAEGEELMRLAYVRNKYEVQARERCATAE